MKAHGNCGVLSPWKGVVLCSSRAANRQLTMSRCGFGHRNKKNERMLLEGEEGCDWASEPETFGFGGLLVGRERFHVCECM